MACTASGRADISYCDAYPNTEAANYYAYGNGSQYSLLTVIRYLSPGFHDAANYKFWLDAGSALREPPNHGQNHSDNSIIPEVDMGGHMRPGDAYTDMGAYESDADNYD